MEFYPICDENFILKPNLWYILSGEGEFPTMRVGHTLLHSTNKAEQERGKLYLIGGANPSECFDDVYSFDLSCLKWTKLKSLGQPRYEHSCLMYDQMIHIFGGATQEQNLNNIISFDLKTQEKWIELYQVKGNRPTARTAHVSCTFRNRLIVFSGGSAQSIPVVDQQVHVYNPETITWSQPNIKGNTPSSRHGHLMVNSNDEYIYLHGGMNGNKFFNDLWKLDLDKCTWTCLEQSQLELPCARAAHGGISTKTHLYIFGGLNENAQALSDFWCLNFETLYWSQVNVLGDNPTPRLDFAYCKLSCMQSSLNEKFQKETREERNEQPSIERTNQPNLVSVFDILRESKDDNFDLPNNSHVTSMAEDLEQKLKNIDLVGVKATPQTDEFYECLVIHGGMDTEGNVYDDCLIFRIH